MEDSRKYLLLDLHSGAVDGFYETPYNQEDIDSFNERYIGSNWVCVKIVGGKVSPMGFPDSMFHSTKLAGRDYYLMGRKA